ncbi:class I SAM-dependent methyltransferase [Patescibacteria group bacterium]|nr:class I SAM-dependent methyltransferase [Patescibacteria group bacterium]
MTQDDFTQKQKEYWHDDQHKKRRTPMHPVIRTYVEPKVAHILQHTNLQDDAAILDVGAGNGYFSYWFDQKGNATAVDYSDVILEGNPIEKKEVMDARKLKFPDNSFDLVFCHAVLHHIDRDDRSKVIEEMKRVSKKYVAFIEPNRNNPLVAAFSILKKEEHGGLNFSKSYCKKLMKDAGLKIVDVHTWGALTPNRMPLSGLLLPLFKLFERTMPFGVTNVVIAEK